MNRTRKISHPSLTVEAEGSTVKFKVNTLLFFSKGYHLGKLDSDHIKTREVPAGAKIAVDKTIYKNRQFVSRTPNGFWFEWTEDEAMLL